MTLLFLQFHPSQFQLQLILQKADKQLLEVQEEDKILVDGFNQIINFVGSIPRQVEAQFRVNPNLQRTQVKGTLRGVTKTTKSATNVIQKDVVRLKNRAVPLNSNQKPKKRSPRQIRSPADIEFISKQIARGRF